MAKFYGVIGYVITKESSPGIWEEVTEEKTYSGDVKQLTQRWAASENLNDDIQINNQISIVADPYATQNLSRIRYVKWMGASWKVTKIEIERPRLLLTIGGVYNEP